MNMNASIQHILRALILVMGFWPPLGLAQTSIETQADVDDLVGKHYFAGIPYEVAHALPPDALPYLLELLNDPSRKEFWVNIVVSIGFLEDPLAVDPLVDFLTSTDGEVDPPTFRALLSVPYALGCIAGGGDPRAVNYLADMVEPDLNSDIRWTFREKPIRQLIAEQSVMGLAVSGQPEALGLLVDLRTQAGAAVPSETKAALRGNLDQALVIFNRIRTEGRAAVLNPKRPE